MKPPLKKNIPYKKYIKYTLIGILSIVGLFLLAALAWALYFNAQFNVYQDDQYKFSIKYPKTWKMVVHPRNNVAVVFVRPKDTALDVMQENFNVTVQPLPADIFTLDELSERLKTQMIGVFGRSVVEYKPIHWGWHQGYRMVLVAPRPDNLIMIIAWTLSDHQAYVLTFLGNINKYPHDYFSVKKLIRSFHLQ